jgi:hypothetical protein
MRYYVDDFQNQEPTGYPGYISLYNHVKGQVLFDMSDNECNNNRSFLLISIFLVECFLITSFHEKRIYNKMFRRNYDIEIH